VLAGTLDGAGAVVDAEVVDADVVDAAVVGRPLAQPPIGTASTAITAIARKLVAYIRGLLVQGGESPGTERTSIGTRCAKGAAAARD